MGFGFASQAPRFLGGGVGPFGLCRETCFNHLEQPHKLLCLSNFAIATPVIYPKTVAPSFLTTLTLH